MAGFNLEFVHLQEGRRTGLLFLMQPTPITLIVQHSRKRFYELSRDCATVTNCFLEITDVVRLARSWCGEQAFGICPDRDRDSAGIVFSVRFGASDLRGGRGQGLYKDGGRRCKNAGVWPVLPRWDVRARQKKNGQHLRRLFVAGVELCGAV